MILPLYFGSIVLTNLAFGWFGTVSVLGLSTPWAAFAAGLTFGLRDRVQDAFGKGVAVAVILAAGVCTALLSPTLAVASVAAFLLGELLDLLVFSRLRRRGFVRASLVSNLFGSLVDSVVFLALAFGSLAFLPGQFIAKNLSGAVATLVLRRGKE